MGGGGGGGGDPYACDTGIVFIMQVFKVRMHIEVTRFRNCAAQFRNWVAILKSEDSFKIGTQFQIAQRNFEIAQIYNSRGTYIACNLTTT